MIRFNLLTILTAILAGLTSFILITELTFATSQNQILANVYVAQINLGNLDRLGATQKLQSALDKMIDQGLTVSFQSETINLPLRVYSPNDPDLIYQMIDWDIQTLLDQAFAVGRNHSPTTNHFYPLLHKLGHSVNISPNFELSKTSLSASIKNAFPTAEQPGLPTDFIFSREQGQLTTAIAPAVPGKTIDLKRALADLTANLTDLTLTPITLHLADREALISLEAAKTLIPLAETAVKNAPYTLVFSPDSPLKKQYIIHATDLSLWLLPILGQFDQPILTLDQTGDFQKFLQTLHLDLDLSPQDARFVVDGNRTKEFVPSRTGLIVDDDQLIAKILLSIQQPDQTEIVIPMVTKEPSVAIASTNDLGIVELLGTGISKFPGSPKNRRANIKHGVEKLNGILIPAGEVFSLVDALKPITAEDGFLPEHVIKGDEIKTEIGGGLCQIGSTLFRTAMNTGLEIVERRNHSLVVSYYNDLTNGNPGTDATIYDPAPDLKIRNNTPKYILLETIYDDKNSQLIFNFYGTSDGRDGHYTPPEVLSWTPHGPTIYKETPDLPLGNESCEIGYSGATTTFDYIIDYADGTNAIQPFFSSYRSMSPVCLVGTGGGI